MMIPKEKVLQYPYRKHPSPFGLALYSERVGKWCAFWPEGTPLTGANESTGLEVRWYWQTEAEALAAIREGLATSATV